MVSSECELRDLISLDRVRNDPISRSIRLVEVAGDEPENLKTYLVNHSR